VSYAVLVDLTICAGGRACVAACKQQNHLPMEQIDYVTITSERLDCYIGSEGSEHRPPLSSKTYTVVEYHDANDNPDETQWVFVKRQCMHCQYPACESACPVGAFRKTPEGPVVYDSYKCMGCRYCMMACPFNVPTYQWEKAIPYVRKCTFCFDRITQDESVPREERVPACVAACPTNCLIFGTREEMLAEARRRIDISPEKYYNHIYGEHEVGGTSWLYISPVPFEKLGFPDHVGEEPYPEYTEAALDSVPPMVVIGGAILAGLYLLWKRRLELAAGKGDTDTSGGEQA
jgi:formate dehydrogenase iron-sulfur subunit